MASGQIHPPPLPVKRVMSEVQLYMHATNPKVIKMRTIVHVCVSFDSYEDADKSVIEIVTSKLSAYRLSITRCRLESESFT